MGQDRRSKGKRKHEGWTGDDRKVGRKRAKELAKNRQIKGPGIFVTCTRGREHKAAHELIEHLEDITERLYPGLVIDQSDDDDERQDKNDASDRNGLRDTDDEGGEEEEDMDALRNGVPPPHRRSATRPESALEKKASSSAAATHIEDQIAAELAEFENTKQPKQHNHHHHQPEQERRPKARFTSIIPDLDCFFFIAVARPIDPVKITFALLDEVRQTGQTRSRFVQRLSPVYNIVRAEMDAVQDAADEIIAKHLPSLPPVKDGEEETSAAASSASLSTFKVDARIRLHDKLKRMDLIQALAKRMPSHLITRLDNPDVLLNVEIYRMVAGLALLPQYETYKRLNPLMLAAEAQEAQQRDLSDSRVITNTSQKDE